jgi:nucleotide-binding universal stress UspA family protein
MQASEYIPQVGRTHPVLVPVDFSASARAGLLYATRMSLATRSPLLVLHVVHDSGDHPGFYRPLDGNPLRPIADVAGEMFDDWMAAVRNESPELDTTLGCARRRLVAGLPGNRIVEVAEAERVAMIVMGTRGRSGLSQLLRSSVTEYVVAHANVPVTILREGAGTTANAQHLKFAPRAGSAASGDY